MSNAPDRLDIGSARYRVANVYVRRFDGDRVHAKLWGQVASGGTLDQPDTVSLALLILMRHKRRPLYDVAVGAASLARRLPEPRSRERVLGAIAAFGEEVFEREVLARLLREEVFRMTEAARIFIEQGKVEGEAKGRAEAVLLLLRRRHGEPPAALAERVRAETDAGILDRWLLLAADAPSLPAFERDMAAPS